MSLRIKSLKTGVLILALFLMSAGEPGDPVDHSLFPLYVDGLLLKNVDVQIHRSSDSIEVDSRSLGEALSDRVQPECLRALSLHAPSPHWVSLQAISDTGLKVAYDSSALEIRILIPPQLRKLRSISVTRARDPGSPPDEDFENREDIIHPSSFSTYLNFNTSQDLVYGSAAAGSRFRQPIQSELDGAINLRSWVLESAASATETTSPGLRRGDTRLVKDQPGSMLRYTLGDVNYPIVGFQRYVPLAGVSVSTNFSLQPYRVITPINHYTILLRSPSTVRIWVNGRIMQTVELPAGPHDFRDFPFVTGVNDVVLEIEDNVGRRERARVSYIFSDLLLTPGTHQVSYALGAPLLDASSPVRSYDPDKILASFSHRYGLTDQFTLGGYYQGNRLQSLLGLTSVYSNTLGTWNLDTGFSTLERLQKPAIASRLSYLYADFKGPGQTQRNLGFEVLAQSGNFSPLGSGYSPYAVYELGGTYSLQFKELATLSLSGRIPIRGNPGSASGLSAGESFALTAARSWSQGLDTSLTLSHSANPSSGGASESIASFLLNWSLPASHQYLIANLSTQSRLARAEWNYNPARIVGGANFEAGVQRDDGGESVDARTEYVGNHGRASFRQDSSHLAPITPGGSPTALSRSSFRVGTALAYTDGQIALSRPISDSFVMVRPVKNVQGQALDVNPQDEGYAEGKSDWLGPAVLPDLVSYRSYAVKVALRDAPPGMSVPQSEFSVFPTYRSGISIRAGTDAALSVSGMLLDSADHPLALLSGEVISEISHPGEKPPVFFTNREGRFFIEQMRPGNYRVDFFDDTPGVLEFEIPSSAPREYDLGKVRLKNH